MATQSALPTRPLPASPFNECLAFFLLLVNMGATAFLNEPEASLVIGVLGVMTLSIIFLVVYQPAPITDKSRMRLLMLWAFGLMLLVMTGRAHSVDLLVVAPNLIFLSCIPLLVIGVSAPIRGFAWFVFPAFGLWMLMINLLYLSLDAEEPQEIWTLLAVAAINLMAGAHLGLSSGPLQRHSGPSLREASIGLRVAIPSVLVAFLVSTSAVSVRHALGPIEFPSLPGLPAISTSSKPVLTAAFRGDAPKNPYWEISGYYVFPKGEYSWMTLAHFYGGAASKGNRAFISDPSNLTDASDLLVYQEKVSTLIAPKEEGEHDIYEYARRYDESLRNDSPLLSLEGSYGNQFIHESSLERPLDIGTYPSGSYLIEKAYKIFERPRYGWNPYEDPDISRSIDRVFLSLPGDPAPHTPAIKSYAYLEEMAPRTVALARKLREGATDEEFIERVLAHFEENLAYHFDHQSMNPEENRLDYFLFEDQKGVCRHFANAFGMIMRLGGVPTRLVGGYAGGDFNPITNTWTVRSRDAHIWNHVWLEKKGWVRIDPTSVVPVEKGVPEGRLSSFFGKLKRQKDRTPPGAHPFSTKGPPNQEEGHAMAPLPPLPLKLILAILGLLVALALCISRLRQSQVSPEDRAWERAIQRLGRSGVLIKASMGPATISSQVAEALTENHPEALQWKRVAAAYERWKYAGNSEPGLASGLGRSARGVAKAMLQKKN